MRISSCYSWYTIDYTHCFVLWYTKIWLSPYIHIVIKRLQQRYYNFRVKYIFRRAATYPAVILDTDAVIKFQQIIQIIWHVIFGQWASYQIRKIAGCACAGNTGNVFPRRRFQRKPIVSDPGMHHGTCVTHVPWCMSGSLTCGNGENVPGIPGACAPAILRIWQEAHVQGFPILRNVYKMLCEINIIRICYIVINGLALLNNLLEHHGGRRGGTQKIFMTTMVRRPVLLAPWICCSNSIKTYRYQLGPLCVFSLWPSDATWRHRFRSKWLFMKSVLWHSRRNFARSAHDLNPEHEFGDYILTITTTAQKDTLLNKQNK